MISTTTRRVRLGGTFRSVEMCSGPRASLLMELCCSRRGMSAMTAMRVDLDLRRSAVTCAWPRSGKVVVVQEDWGTKIWQSGVLHSRKHICSSPNPSIALRKTQLYQAVVCSMSPASTTTSSSSSFLPIPYRLPFELIHLSAAFAFPKTSC